MDAIQFLKHEHETAKAAFGTIQAVPAGSGASSGTSCPRSSHSKKYDTPTTPLLELIPTFGLLVYALETCWKRYPA